ncbi:hypothetical protein HS088_TW03G01001 [Tripterygium wilfordii]|uniref:Uncharacterized protein n=1 Tax=Tripterygium wilfordii TaxID=458696 RepID=A0A7J7DWB0_TRIWF|nr:uncharacterized protein LOC119987798 [Tripterygium wilfordii]KAF5750662.1 hypothetical protein HS088_TW03G01001 [Tripterygium wilfordii]
MDVANKSSISVQRVNKKSSDELLKKFADDEPDPAPSRLAKRRKKREVGGDSCESPNSHSSSLTERRSLLPPAASKSALLRQFRICRSRLRAKGIKNKSLFGTIEKTWRRTVEGASRVFMEKHYNRHRRLINDVV